MIISCCIGCKIFMKIPLPGSIFCLLLFSKVAVVNGSEAEETYFRTCVVCHGDDGSGTMPGVSDLADSETLFRDSEKAIVARLGTGIQRPGGISMPPRGGDPDLTDEQLLIVLRYVKQLVKQ